MAQLQTLLIGSILLASTEPTRLRAWYEQAFGTTAGTDGFLRFGEVGLLIVPRDDVAAADAQAAARHLDAPPPEAAVNGPPGSVTAKVTSWASARPSPLKPDRQWRSSRLPSIGSPPWRRQAGPAVPALRWRPRPAPLIPQRVIRPLPGGSYWR
jgi:hypothetical protein